jgi:methionyl-tRNA synthetase
VMNRAADLLWRVSILLSPIMPDKMKKLQRCLGFAPDTIFTIKDISSGEIAVAANKVEDTGGLFQRILVEKTQPQAKPAKQQKQAVKVDKKQAEDKAETGLITFDEFFHTQLKTAKIVEAEKIEGTDKLLKLQIDVGGDSRQLVAGIAESYSPEEIIGKTIVIVANLKPAKIRGVESQGMLLAAKDPDGLKLITVDGYVGSGITVG